MSMQINNPPKLYGILVAMVIIGALMATGAVDQVAGVPLLTLLVGYLVGNGVAAKNGQTSEPVVTPKDQPPSEEATA